MILMVLCVIKHVLRGLLPSTARSHTLSLRVYPRWASGR